MNRQFARLASSLILLVLGSAPAFAHHLMGGRTPASFTRWPLVGSGAPGDRPRSFRGRRGGGLSRRRASRGVRTRDRFRAGDDGGCRAAFAWGDGARRGNPGGAVRDFPGCVHVAWPQMLRPASHSYCSPLSDSSTAMRSVNRSMARSRRRSMPICSASRSSKARSRWPLCRSRARYARRPAVMSPLRLVGAGIAGIGLGGPHAADRSRRLISAPQCAREIR